MAKGFLHLKKYNLIYARVPKVANSSIKTCLAQLVKTNVIEGLKPTNDRYWRVCTDEANFMTPERYTELYEKKVSFTFLRNPFDRLFSCYVNKILVDKAPQGFSNRGYTPDMSFDAFLAHTCTMSIEDMDVHVQPQEYLISDLQGRLPKFIGLLETIGEDWGGLQKLLQEQGIMKWSGKIGQCAKMYPTLKLGYTNDQETQFFEQV